MAILVVVGLLLAAGIYYSLFIGRAASAAGNPMAEPEPGPAWDGNPQTMPNHVQGAMRLIAGLPKLEGVKDLPSAKVLGLALKTAAAAHLKQREFACLQQPRPREVIPGVPADPVNAALHERFNQVTWKRMEHLLDEYEKKRALPLSGPMVVTKLLNTYQEWAIQQEWHDEVENLARRKATQAVVPEQPPARASALGEPTGDGPKHCSECGAKLTGSRRFCGACGTVAGS